MGEPLRQRKPHRLPGNAYASPDREFFFTLCARHLGQPFVRPQLAQAVIESLMWRSRHSGWILHCYCLMPDHLHFIARPGDGPDRAVDAGARGQVVEGLLEQVGAFKRYTITQVWWTHGGAGPLWQRSSYDRVLRYYESIDEAAGYVLDNPVRKGLVERREQYPYCGIVEPWC